MFHYLLCWLFHFCFLKSGWGQGISYFFSDSLNFCLLVFFSVSFIFLIVIFSTFIYVSCCPGTGNVFFCFDVLYFHSCGIVGIMMVMTNWLTFCCLESVYVECELWVFVLYDKKIQYTKLQIRSCNMWGWCVLFELNTLNVSVQRKKRSPVNSTACDWVLMVLYVKNCP